MAKRKRVTVAEAIRIIRGRSVVPQCSTMGNDSTRCQADARWKVTRADGSSFVICGHHAATFQRMRERRPEAYGAVTVTHL